MKGTEKAMALFVIAIMTVGAVSVVSDSTDGAPTGNWVDYAVTSWYDSDPHSDSYTIESAEELAGLAKLVNSGTNFSETIVKLSENAQIDLSKHEWTPIGTGSRLSSIIVGETFKGTFDGQNSTISGLTITNYTEEGVGLFGFVVGGTVKNLTLTNVEITTNLESTGAVVGAMSSSATIENVDVESGTVKGSQGVGGIVGRILKSGSVSQSNNSATVEGTVYNTGGIAGAAYYNNEGMSISECNNTGAVTSKTGAGGIVGFSSADISKCTNSGRITGTGQVGGIVGEQQNSGSITSCINQSTATVSNTGSAQGTGGIVGWVRYNGSDSSYSDKSSISVVQCENHAAIDGGSASHAGGIVGCAFHSITVSGCKNSGSVETSASFSGGIIGGMQTTDESHPGEDYCGLTLTGNETTGTVDGNGSTGLIIGHHVDKNTWSKCSCKIDHESYWTVYGNTWSGDGTTGLEDIQSVATIVFDDITYGYPNVTDAVAASPDNGNTTTITLISGTTENVTIPKGKNIVIELNGFTITGASDSSTIINNGTLTLTGEGKIVAIDGEPSVTNYGNITLTDIVIESSGYSLENYNGGTLLMTNGSVTSSMPGGSAVWNGGEAELDNVTVTGNNGAAAVYGGADDTNNPLPSTTTIRNCTINQSGQEGSSWMATAIAASSEAVINVYDCNFDVPNYGFYIFSSGGTMNVYDGTYKTTTQDVFKLSLDNTAYAGAASALNIYAGTFTGPTPTSTEENCSVTISGGTFYSSEGNPNTTIPETFIAQGYEIDETGNVVVKQDSAVVNVTRSDGSYKSYADLYTAYMNSDNGSEIKLLKDIELDSTLVLDRGTSVTIDLAGNDITAAEGNVIRIESGTITIRDSESSCSIDESDWTVDYSGGKIATTAGNTSHAVTVSGNRAQLIMESGMVESVANCGVYVTGNISPGDNSPAYDCSFTMTGGYIHAKEYGVGVGGNGAEFTIEGGYIVTEDNAAIAGNGSNDTTKNYGGTIININGGTAISNIETSGCISCGIYHPHKGILNINGGKIVSTNGIGVLMRGGSYAMNGGEILALGTDKGTVGDSKVLNSGSGMYVDLDSNYYDNANIHVGIEKGSISSEGDAIIFLDTDGDKRPVDYIQVAGGSFSSDVTEFCTPGNMAEWDETTKSFGIVTAPDATIDITYDPLSPSDSEDVTVTVTISGIQDGADITYVWNGTSETVKDTSKNYTVSSGTSSEQTLVVSFTSYNKDYSETWSHTFYVNHTVSITFPDELGIQDQQITVRDGLPLDLSAIDTSGLTEGYEIRGYSGYTEGEPVISDFNLTPIYGLTEPSVNYSIEYHDGYSLVVVSATHDLADSYMYLIRNADGEEVDANADGILKVETSGTYNIYVAAMKGGSGSDVYGIKTIDGLVVNVHSGSDEPGDNPSINPGDDEEDVPPIIRPGGSDSSSSTDDTVTIVACAAAAVVAALMAVFLIVLYRKD